MNSSIPALASFCGQRAPSITRWAAADAERFRRYATERAGIGQFAAVQTIAPSLGVELSPVDVRDAGEIERAVTAFARAPNGV
jgi:putative ABC transport system substrate-binding protein